MTRKKPTGTHTAISKDQFNQYAADVSVPGGGFSAVHYTTGQPVGDAYMVGGVVPTEHLPAPISGSQLEHFANQRAQILSNSRYHMGGWHGGQVAGKPIDIDVSEKFGLHEESGARVAAINRDEMAIGRLRGGTYTDLHNPVYSGREPHRTLGELKKALASSWE